MKIQIVGCNENEEKKFKEIIKNLPNVTTQVLENSCKFNIKYPPAMIIDNVVVDDIGSLSTNELKNVILQFFET